MCLRRHEASVIDPHSVFCVHLGEREGEKRGEDTQGGFSLYVPLRPCGRQMCVRVKLGGGVGGGAGKVCVHAHTGAHLHTLASVCTSLFDLLFGF